MKTTYRIREPKKPFDIINMSELADSISTYEFSEDDGGQFVVFGEWYCQHSECPCREVRIKAKWPDGDKPADLTFNCPCCGAHLKFHGFLNEQILVPCNA